MKHYKAISFLVFLFAVVHCSAQTIKEDHIDEEYHKCLLKDTGYVTICDCAFVAYEKWEKEMNNTYDKLLKTLKKEKEKTALKQSQNAWATYKEAEFTTYNYIFNIPGNKWCSIRQDGRIDIVRSRTLQLRNYLESLKKDESKFK